MLATIRHNIKNPLFKETFIYTLTDVIGKAMSFVLLPIVSFYMPPDELGLATNFTVITSLISLFAGLAVVNSLPYFFYEQDKNENRTMISNLLLICTVLSGGLGFIIFCIHQIIETYLQLSLYLQILGVLFVLGMLSSQVSLILMRLENRSKQFASLQIFQIVFHAAAVLLWVIYMRKGGVGKIYAETFVYIIMGLIHLFILHKKGYISFRWDSKWVRTLVKFGAPLLPHSISFWFKSGMDKVFITTYCGLQFNGLYSMAISISAIYTILVNSFFNAYTPYLQKLLIKFDDGKRHWEEKQRIVRQTYILFGLFGLVGVFALACSWFIFHYMIDSKYLQALDYMPLILFANFIYTFYNFTIQYIYKMKKTLIMGLITFIGSIIQLLFSYILIRLYGVMGAVYSFLIGNVLITIGIAIYSNRVYEMPWLNLLQKRI